MAATYRYFVLKLVTNDNWNIVIGSEGNRSYALGWFHALTSLYPRPAYRLVKYNLHPSKHIIVEQSNAVSRPKPTGAK